MLFVLCGLVNDERPAIGNRIEITSADVEQLVLVFEKQWRRTPDALELKGLIDGRIREEVLYREALAMGLDEDDTIVRRRLAQKVEFLIGDAEVVAEPDDDTLQAYYDENAERYRAPPILSFFQIYFSSDRRGERAEVDAEALLARLRAASSPVRHAPREGNPFMLPQVYFNRESDQIERNFGPAFSQQASRLETG